MDFVGTVIRNKIKELGQLWKSSENHMKISIDVLNSWDTLISEWAEDESMPLIIRKGSSRGQEFTHPSGRKVIISDNTFALWVYRNVLDGKTYSLLELKNKLNSKLLPAFILQAESNLLNFAFSKIDAILQIFTPY